MLSMLIVFEGIDASGKTTISRMVKEFLEVRGFKTALYTYPNKSSIYGSIINLFLKSKISLTPQEQFFLYLLDMYRDKQDVVDKLSKNFIVLMDRYYTSTIAYQCTQGFDYGIAKTVIEYLDMPKPNIIIYLDIDPKTAIERKLTQKKSLDVFEGNIEFLANVRKLYLKMAGEGYPTKKWIVIDASKEIKEIYKDVVKALNI